nr:glycosyltransferase [uncultured Oscillibacter sp.]
MEHTPVLSIGIIFKNEIRCLERCLKSLHPLREALPCELVMADTGSDDGSREVAQKYADILFDFPWINDFAAARNAVMDRCSGKWYFSIDADEWLDEDVSELVRFFSPGGDEPKADVCAITEHNYYWQDFDRGYGSFMPWRLLRMSTGVRFQGEIHENWPMSSLRCMGLSKVLLHHDGYVSMNVEGDRGKRERNLKPLRAKLEKDPDNLLVRLQIIESGGREPDFEEQIRAAVSLVEKRAKDWNLLGPSVLRHAVSNARDRKFPEIEKWIHMAEELFPDSYFIRMDAAFNAAAYYLETENFEESVRWARIGLQAHEDYREYKGDFAEQIYGSLQSTTPLSKASLQIILARALFELGHVDEAAEPLAGFSFTLLDKQWTMNLLETLQMFQFRSEMDTAPLITRLWEEICLPEPNQKWADERRDIFLRTALARFDADYLKREKEDPTFRRRVYTLYSPLLGKSDLGAAAAVLDSGSPEEQEALLGTVERWDTFPVSALAHAMRTGAMFPVVSARPVKTEELDSLAARLAGNWEELYAILNRAVSEDYTGSWQSLAWVCSLALAAVQVFPWKDGLQEGMALARTFARVEGVFLTGYYSPEVLQEGNLWVLPSMHRFGWYCDQAFNVLEAGDSVSYVRLLREGLAACEGMKRMAEYLLDHTPELQKAKPTPELLALAEKVKTMLAAYPADAPAVEALKASPVYQRVSGFIEGESE